MVKNSSMLVKKFSRRLYPSVTIYVPTKLDRTIMAKARVRAKRRRQSLSSFLVTVLDEYFHKEALPHA